MSQLEGDDSKIARVIGLKKYNFLIQQAKEMDKQQKKKDFEKGYECGVGDYIDCENGFDCKSIGFEQYYNEEYGGEQ